jgi:HlyD family secretion protein
LASAEAKLADVQKPANAGDLQAAQLGVQSAQASLNSAMARLQQVQAGATASDLASAQSGVDSASANVRSAEVKLEQILAGPQDAELVAVQSSLTQAQNNLSLKLNPYTEADLLAQQQAVRQAEANLQSALSPSTTYDIESQRLSVVSAQASLSKAQNPNTPADVLAAQASVEQARAGLASAQNDISSAVISAPFDGVVSAVAVNAGETAGNTSTITLVNPNRIRVNVQVDEADIAQIQVAQSANLTFDALSGRRFTGTVASVAPTGTTTQGVVGYQVTIELPEGRGVRPGMTGTAQIVTDQRTDVLMVPNRALTRATATGPGQPAGAARTGTAGGTQRAAAQSPASGETAQQPGRAGQVSVLAADGTQQTRAIRVGLANDSNTEVISGLEEGDTVVLPTTTARASVPGANNVTGGLGGAPTGGAPAGPVVR